jgi:hypothetical protein
LLTVFGYNLPFGNGTNRPSGSVREKDLTGRLLSAKKKEPPHAPKSKRFETGVSPESQGLIG